MVTIVAIVVLVGVLLLVSEVALGLDLKRSVLPFGGGNRTYYTAQDSIVQSDSSYAYHAAKDSGGVWIHFDSLILQNKLHYFTLDSIYTAFDGDRDSQDGVVEEDELMVFSPDSSILNEGMLFYYGESQHKYVDSTGNPIVDTIMTRAKLKFRTLNDEPLAIEKSIPELDGNPALRVTNDFKVNIIIEAKTPGKSSLKPKGVWLPSIVLFDSLPNWQEPLYSKIYTGFSPRFYYDVSAPQVGPITVTAKSSTSMEICWEPPSVNTDSIVLEVKTGESDDFIHLETFLVTDSVNCYLHSDLDTVTVYSYRIRGINVNGQSENSPSVTESTAAHKFSLVPGSTSGYTPIDAQINESGGVSASIPITIPTGTAGIQPQLTLGVSQNNGEPSVGGFSVISRVSPTYAQDGIMKGIEFIQDDRYVLDGERLIAIQGNYGEAGAKYRTEQETFQQITSEGSRESGPTTFTIQTKDGLIKKYGHTEDSKIELDGDENKIMYWLLNRVEDVYGNYYTISYDEETANGSFYPSKIEYTGNDEVGLTPYCHIQFEYEDRPDVFAKFMLGYSSKRTKRLKSIKTYYENSLTRKYDLSYTEIGLNLISFLGSVTEYGADGSNFTSSVFRWQDEEQVEINEFSQPDESLSTFSDELKPYSLNGLHERFIDVNNDGKSDYVFVPEGEDDLYVATSNGTGLDQPVQWLSSGSFGKTYSKDGQHEHFADFNADNYIDYAWVPEGSTNLWVALNNNGVLSEPTIWLSSGSAGSSNPYSVKGEHEFFMDFDGDGRSDYIFYPENENAWFIAFSSGDGFKNNDSKILIDAGDNAGNSLISNEGKHEAFMDLNSDGFLDFIYKPVDLDEIWVILAIPDREGEFYDASIWLSNGDAEGSVPYSQDGKFEAYADVNGDGLVDRIWKPFDKNKLYVALSNGCDPKKRCFPEAPVPWLDKAEIEMDVYSTDGKHQSFIDINRDGFADFLYSPHDKEGIYVAYSTGSSFAQPRLLLAGTVNEVKNTSTGTLHDKYGDINGDGIIDKIWLPEGKSELYVAFLSAPNPLLASITNGHGLQTTYEYKPLTDNSVYERGSGATYPNLNFQAPIYVASQQITNDGIGGDYSIQYKYFDAQLDVSGRGFRGFGKTENIDIETGNRSTAYFNRQFEHVGTKVERTQEFANGTLISETINDLKLLNNGLPDVNWSYIEKSTTNSYELDGSLIKSTTSYYEYDQFGNPTYIEVNYDDGFKDVTENTYDNIVDKWHLGRLRNSTVTREIPGSVKQRSSSFDYNARYGILEKEVIEPESSLRFEKEYKHDKFGNVTESVSNGSGEIRKHTTKYDDKGRFVIESTNALGHTETIVREPYYGMVSSITGPNELTSHFKYDGFGRKIQEISPDGNMVRMVYRKDESVTNAVYYVLTEATGSPESITYFDILDRAVRTKRINFDGTAVKIDVVYNHRGQVDMESDPYTTNEQWTTYEYDAINRPTKIKAPGGRVSQVRYKGLTTEYENAKEHVTTQREDVIGRLVEIIDPNGAKLNYEYNALGDVILISDAAGNQIVNEYDNRGNRTKLTDPDIGTFQYTFNAFGELTSQTYPDNSTVSLKWDALSRLIERSEPEGTTTWTYDTHFKGKLSEVTADGYGKSIAYDNYGRPITETLNLEGEESYVTSNMFDAYGRTHQITYPSGLTVVNKYNEFGYLSEVSNENGLIYWQAISYNERGQSTEQMYGNGISVEQVFNSETGFIEQIESSNIQGSIQHLSMTHDLLGNIISRTDEKRTLTEQFTYDDINRLTSSTVGSNSVTLQYDAIGNITYKSDVGAYTYGENGAGPHAVTSISGVTCPSFSIEEIDYYSFQKVKELRKDTVSLSYEYGPDRIRFRSVTKIRDSVAQKKTYVGNIYEHIEEGDSIKEQHYIHTPEGVVAVETIINGGTSEVKYLHKDHLGSVQTISDENGIELEVLSYDAWGRPRDADTWEALDLNPNTLLERGFTMHEFMSLFTLINMNGRIYDPLIGRFISADPFIDGVTDLQGYNRYSYVRNNPLTLVDPSGYGWLSKIWKSVKKTVKKVGRAVGDFWDKHKVQIVSIGIGLVTGGIGAIVGNAIAGSVIGAYAGVIGSGFGFGFGSTTSGALLSGASLGTALKAGFKRGVISGVVAAATFGIGEHIGHATDWGNIGQKIASHGVVQGASEVAQGGKFEHGFLAGASGAISGFATRGMNSFVGRTAVSAAVGGTASVIGGGKFANGAQSAAFVTMYNDMGLMLLNSIRGSLNRTPDMDARYVDPSKSIFYDKSGRQWIKFVNSEFFHGKGSVKYISHHENGISSYEAILNNGKWVTTGMYKGTFNYIHADKDNMFSPRSLGHAYFDILPWLSYDFPAGLVQNFISQ